MFHGTPRAIQSINGLLNGKNENISNIHRQFADNSLKKYFSRNQIKIIFPRFSVDFSSFQKIVQKLTENFPKNNRPRLLSKAFSRVL